MDNSQKLATAPGVDTGQVLLVILYLILIIVGAYFLTKYVAKRRLQQGMRPTSGSIRGWRGAGTRPQPGHMVSVVDRIAIDREKTLMVVEFEGKYYLIGTTQQDLKFFDKIPVPAEEAEAVSEKGAAPDQPDATEAAGMAVMDTEPGETFGQRFSRAFSIVLRSYLPAGLRDKKSPGTRSSFEDELKARAHAKSGSSTKNKDHKTD